MPKKILIVDDSALVRKQLTEIIQKNFNFDIDYAKNGQEAYDKALAQQYDVITMDINMPVANGLEATKAIMEEQPTPILMVSSLTADNAATTIEAMEYGAVDYVTKPGTMNIGLRENMEDIVAKVKSLSRIPKSRYASLTKGVARRTRPSKRIEHDACESKDIKRVVLIGASTGGPGLIEQICAMLPATYPYPVFIVQHMPEQFTKSFAERLDKVSNLEVHHTSQNMVILPGNVYLARGGVHMHFARKTSGTYVIREETEAKGRAFQPSVDEMFMSGVKVFGAKNIISVLLTGIGDDGADGMVEVKQGGGFTIGENEESCTVYGMPREAYERGGVLEQLPFKQIAQKLAAL